MTISHYYHYGKDMITHTIQEYVELLADERFHDVDYTVIRAHVPYLKDITLDELLVAVQKHKDKTPAIEYRKPNLKHVVPYLYKEVQHESEPHCTTCAAKSGDVKVIRRKRQKSIQDMRRDKSHKHTLFDLAAKADENVVYEERIIYLQILKSSYYKQIGKPVD